MSTFETKLTMPVHAVKKLLRCASPKTLNKQRKKANSVLKLVGSADDLLAQCLAIKIRHLSELIRDDPNHVVSTNELKELSKISRGLRVDALRYLSSTQAAVEKPAEPLSQELTQAARSAGVLLPGGTNVRPSLVHAR